MTFKSTKVIELGSCAFRQPNATSHCRFLHGYRLVAKFWFEAKNLDENNWVVDFGGLKDLKQILKDQFDHTTCISRTDPKLEQFKRLRDEGVCDLRVMDGVGIEKFAEWCFKTANGFVSGMTSNRCQCVKVEVFEHEDNSAIYEVNQKDYLADRIEDDIKTAEEIAEEVATAADNKQSKDMTMPPFAKGKPEKKGQPLRNRRSTSWADPKGTFGL